MTRSPRQLLTHAGKIAVRVVLPLIAIVVLAAGALATFGKSAGVWQSRDRLMLGWSCARSHFYVGAVMLDEASYPVRIERREWDGAPRWSLFWGEGEKYNGDDLGLQLEPDAPPWGPDPNGSF